MSKNKKASKTKKPAQRRKKKLPDLLTGRYLLVSRQGQILDAGGVFRSELPVLPMLFESRTHARAYAQHNDCLEAVIEKLSRYYGERFEIKDGEDGKERITAMLVPREKAQNFGAALTQRLMEKYAPKISELKEEALDYEEIHRREISERMKAYRERKKKLEKAIAQLQKERDAFIKNMKKLR